MNYKFAISILFTFFAFACNVEKENSSSVSNTQGASCQFGETELPHGWSGPGFGPNSCNTCSCGDGVFLCTQMACMDIPLGCTLADGSTVDHGWQGNDRGSNFCNSCSCTDGGLSCTEMYCGDQTVIE